MDFEEVQIYISNTVQLPAWIVNLYSNFWVRVLDEHVEICWTWNSSYLRSAQITATHYVLDVKKTDVGLLATRRAKAKHIYFVRSLRTQSKLSGVEAGGWVSR
jgi:hypothetical protein